MASRLPPDGSPPSIDEINNELMRMSINEIDSELIRIPNTLLPRIKQDLWIPQEKDLATMTADEKERIFALYCRKYRDPGPGAPQQPPNLHGPSSMPLAAPADEAYQSMTGFDSPRSPIIVSTPTPGMMNDAMHMTLEVGPIGLSSS